MAVESAAMDVDIMKDNMAIMKTMKATVQMQKDMMHAMGELILCMMLWMICKK